MLDKLKVGIIVKPQGIKGEVKVQPLTDDINRFNDLKEVIIDGNSKEDSDVEIIIKEKVV